MNKIPLTLGLSLSALLLSACGDNAQTSVNNVGPSTFSTLVKNEICLGTSDVTTAIIVEDVSIADDGELVDVENLCG